jgi:hypothetical protein
MGTSAGLDERGKGSLLPPSSLTSKGGASTSAAAAAPTHSLATAVTTSQLAEEYTKLLDAVGTPNYEIIQSLFAGYGCPPANTIPSIQVSFELFEAVQNRFAATKQVLERTKADLLSRNQQYTVMNQDLHRLQEEYEVLRKRNAEAEERNTELHQQRAKLEVSVEQLRREVGQGRTALDALRNKLARREEELRMSQSRVAENLVALSQKDAVVNTLRRELLKKGVMPYGTCRNTGVARSGADSTNDEAGTVMTGEDGIRAAEGGDGDAAGAAAQDAYTADMLESIAADVEGRAQEARMKLNVADLESRLSRLQEEKDSVLAQHTQYRQHVQLALQSYESEALLREDAMGRHVCLRTPYFGGEQEATYAQVVDLQTGERKRDNADEGGDAAAGGTATLPSFAALTFEIKRILERFAKVHIDDSSRLHGGLSLCVAAQRRALQAGADLVGFLSTMEEEVLRRRLTLPEVREEWRKACVPEFALAVAATLRESASELGKGLVGLLEQENAFVAEIEGAKAAQQQRTSSLVGSGSTAAETSTTTTTTTTTTMNTSVTGKQKKKGGQQDANDSATLTSAAAEHVDVGVMARPTVVSQDAAVQVDVADVVDANAEAPKTAVTTTAASADGAATPPPPLSPKLSQTTAQAAGHTADSVAGPPSPRPPRSAEVSAVHTSAGSTPGKARSPSASLPKPAEVVDAEDHHHQTDASGAPSFRNSPSASTAHQLEQRPPPPAAVNDRRADVAAADSIPIHPSSDAPIVLSGVCPHCAHTVTLTNDASVRPHAAHTGGASAADANAGDGATMTAVESTPSSLTDFCGREDGHAVGTADPSSPQLPFSGSRRPSTNAASPQSPVELPDAVRIPAGETAAEPAQTVSTHTQSSPKRSVNTSTGNDGPLVSAHDSAVACDAHASVGADLRRHSGDGNDIGSASAGSAHSLGTTAALLEYQQRLTATEQALAAVQATNEELRAQLAAALAAAAAAKTPTNATPAADTDRGTSNELSEGSHKGSGEGGAPSPNNTTLQRNPSGLSSHEKSTGEANEHPQPQHPVVSSDAVGDAAHSSVKPKEGTSVASTRDPAAAQEHREQTTDAARASNASMASPGVVTKAFTASAADVKTSGDVAALAQEEKQLSPDTTPHTTIDHSGTASDTTAAGGGRQAPPADQRHTESNLNHSIVQRPYMPTPPPPRSRPVSSHTSVSTAAAAASATVHPSHHEQEGNRTLSAAPHTTGGVSADRNAVQHSTNDHPGAASRPASHLSYEGSAIDGDGKRTVVGSDPAPDVPSPPSPQPGVVVGHGTRREPTPAKHAPKLPVAGYPGSAIGHDGPVPSFGPDLVITGSRSQPAHMTRWAAADRSLTTASPPPHYRDLAGIGSHTSNNASLTTAVTTKGAFSSSSVHTTSIKSVKHTGGHATKATRGAAKVKAEALHGDVKEAQQQQPPQPLPLPIRTPSPPLPPVRASSMPTDTPLPPFESLSAASTSHVSAFSSPVPKRPALPAIPTGDSSHSKHVSRGGAADSDVDTNTNTYKDDAGVQQVAGTAMLTQDRSHRKDVSWLEVSAQGVERPHDGLPSHRTGDASSFTPPCEAAQRQTILQAMLSPAPPPQLLTTTVVAASSAPAKLFSRQELQLLYRVLRLRLSTSSRLVHAGRRSVAGFGVNGTALPVRRARPDIDVRATVGGGTSAGSRVPGGCVSRPLILRRVRDHRRRTSYRITTIVTTATADAADTSLSFLTSAIGREPSTTHSHHNTTSKNSTHLPTQPPLLPPPTPTPPLALHFVLMTPADEPRRWSTCGAGNGGVRRWRTPRTWQQQQRFERARWRRQSSCDSLVIRGMQVSGGGTTDLSRPPPAPSRTFPPFTAENLARAPPERRTYQPFLFSPLPLSAYSTSAAAVPGESGNETGSHLNTIASSSNNTLIPLQNMVSRVHIYQRMPRRPTRAVLRCAKRDSTRRAVKRNVYAVAATAEVLPSYHSL